MFLDREGMNSRLSYIDVGLNIRLPEGVGPNATYNEVTACMWIVLEGIS